MYESDPEDLNKKSSIRNTSNALLDAYATKKIHEEDAERINRRRGRNEAKPRIDDEDTINDNNDGGNKTSSLPNKDELDEFILKCKKRVDDTKVVNCDAEVYELFRITGFSEMMEVEKKRLSQVFKVQVILMQTLMEHMEKSKKLNFILMILK